MAAAIDIDGRLVDRLYAQAQADHWRVPRDRFARALEASAERAFSGRSPGSRELERYLSALHLQDLALALACAAGDEPAWEHFVLQHRPLLYRAADAIDAHGGARDLADSLYGELFGVRERAGARLSLFLYFHGRSSLATWLRTVLAQRHVDRLRSTTREDALPDDESPAALQAPERPVDPGRQRLTRLMHQALASAVDHLSPRDRLRLACYYAQDLTLAETGRVLREHEATVSRQLSRTRKSLREETERRLRADHGFGDAELALCFEAVVEDAGPLDLRDLLGSAGTRKESVFDRSK